MIGWRGNHITHMDFAEHAKKYGAPFWGFHRASLHKCLLDRAVELGSSLEKLEGGWRRVGRGGRRVHSYSARREEVQCGFGRGR